MEAGASDEHLYPSNRELGCAVCSSYEHKALYARWGSRSCPTGNNMLYEGFMASGHSGHRGSGANTLCMHNDPEFPPGYSSGNQDGNLLYGMEYLNTGALDLNHKGDAACVVCEHDSASNVFTQWGRVTCSNNYRTEYSGLIMSSYYSQHKGESVCVDLKRATHPRSSSTHDSGGLLYTSEMIAGASDEYLYAPHNELACAVCSRHFDACDVCSGLKAPLDAP